jgi:hypothetical protein
LNLKCIGGPCDGQFQFVEYNRKAGEIIKVVDHLLDSKDMYCLYRIIELRFGYDRNIKFLGDYCSTDYSTAKLLLNGYNVK